jgi:hypothetical protein
VLVEEIEILLGNLKARRDEQATVVGETIRDFCQRDSVVLKARLRCSLKETNLSSVIFWCIELLDSNDIESGKFSENFVDSGV